ncbi:Nucleoside diphosphate kinase [hydrothermal vent metagenome]|uniref:nucleoside-diphosphate kinase n=1 Tax=hydrothermal vent metagenome TaxID=652676 RepID=A0A3B1D9P7_9ZZZZ
MKEAALVIIKPDGISKNLIGNVMTKFADTGLEIVATRVVRTTRKLAENHYEHLKDRPFFKDTVDYFIGTFHKRKNLVAIVYFGNNAVKKCRKVAGATNPEEADPASIRGSYGRITTKGIYENVVHVSSDKAEAEREIKLWFRPAGIAVSLYPSNVKTIEAHKEKVWA